MMLRAYKLAFLWILLTLSVVKWYCQHEFLEAPGLKQTSCPVVMLYLHAPTAHCASKCYTSVKCQLVYYSLNK